MELTRRGLVTSAAVGLAAASFGTAAAAQSGRTLLKGGCVLSLDPEGRRLRHRGRADRGREDRRRPAKHHRHRAGDRRREHDRDARLRRHASAHVAGRGSQQPAQRAARRLRPRHPGLGPRRDEAGGRPHRRSGERARRDQRRRDHAARLVAHRQQSRAHRCGDRGAARIGRARGVRVRRRRRWARQPISGRHPPAAEAVLLVERSAADAGHGSGPVGRRVGGGARGGRVDIGARERRRSPAWRSQSVPTSPTSTATRSPSGPGRWWPTREGTSRSPARSRWRWATAFRRFSRRSTTASARV